MSLTLSDPEALARLHVYASSSADLQTSGLIDQMAERISLVNAWKIHAGARVLEVGCGQGDCTIPLAAAVGEEGHVTALDPANLDYGSPKTLGQAQTFLREGPFGARITFIQADAIEFISSKHPSPADPPYDFAILAQSSWYFSSPAQLQATLRALGSVARRVCIAEYALTASQPSAFPHVLAALTQAALECRKPVSESNIRTVLSPAGIRALASGAGLKLEEETTITPPAKMYDGRWEVSAVRNEAFVRTVQSEVKDERERAVVLAMRDAVLASVSGLLKDVKVSTMDVWVATFVAATD